MIETQTTFSTAQTAPGQPAEKRAATLRSELARRGGSVRVTSFGHVERREPSGRVAGRYGPDVVALAVAEGWLVEAKRRPGVGPHDEVEYRLRADVDVALAEPVAEREPERPEAPRPVRRVTRKRAASGPPPDSAPEPLPFAVEVVGPEEAAEALAPRREAGRKRRERDRRSLPTVPPPLADGTECLTREAAEARWGVKRSTLRTALWKGALDRGPGYLPEGQRGRGSISVALTPRTLAYVGAHWTAAPRVVELAAGVEMPQGAMFEALGYSARVTADQVAPFEGVPNRYAHPTNPRRGRFYRVGTELVEAAAAVGVTVILRQADGVTEAAPEPATPDWREVCGDGRATGTPVLDEHGAHPNRQRDVADVLIEAGRPLTTAEIAEALGLRASTCHNRLVRMERRGEVSIRYAEDGSAGRYAWTPVHNPTA